MNALCATERAGGAQNGGYFTADNQQRLLAEEAELDRMVKELQATLPPSEGLPDRLIPGGAEKTSRTFASVMHRVINRFLKFLRCYIQR